MNVRNIQDRQEPLLTLVLLEVECLVENWEDLFKSRRQEKASAGELTESQTTSMKSVFSLIRREKLDDGVDYIICHVQVESRCDSTDSLSG